MIVSGVSSRVGYIQSHVASDFRCIFSSNESSTPTVISRIVSKYPTTHHQKPLWRHSSISLETKLRVYQASVLSVLLYGSECWPISTSLCSRLSAFDMQAQRTITNTKWFEYKTNIEGRTLTNRQPIQRYIAQGRLRWLGHLLRSPPNHPALAIYTFNPMAAGWSRPRGAPRTRWSDVLGKDLKQLGTTLMEASNIALDRSSWRSTIVARAVSTPSWQEP